MIISWKFTPLFGTIFETILLPNGWLPCLKDRLLRPPGGACPPSGAQPEPDSWKPVITRPDPMSAAEWEALLAASVDETEPPAMMTRSTWIRKAVCCRRMKTWA